MEARATAKYVGHPPRKMRQVLDMVRGCRVEEALNLLHFTQKAAALPIEKTIRSAVANAAHVEGSGKLEVEHFIIKTAYVNVGPTARRFVPRAMGRATRIRKRSGHITVVVSDQK